LLFTYLFTYLLTLLNSLEPEIDMSVYMKMTDVLVYIDLIDTEIEAHHACFCLICH